jgi:hypothetical protein
LSICTAPNFPHLAVWQHVERLCCMMECKSGGSLEHHDPRKALALRLSLKLKSYEYLGVDEDHVYAGPYAESLDTGGAFIRGPTPSNRS